MIAPREMIVRDALKLSEGAHAKVVQELLDSLSPEVGEVLDDSWAEEFGPSVRRRGSEPVLRRAVVGTEVSAVVPSCPQK